MRIPSALIASLLVFAGCGKIIYGEKTIYAEGYSARKFDQLQQGMTQEKVISILGEPLWRTNEPWSEVWTYVPNRNGSSAKKDEETFNIFGQSTILTFDRDGIVASAVGDYLDGELLGMRKVEVETRFGIPSSRQMHPAKTFFFYSKRDPSGSGTYKRREVHFDEGGKLIGTASDLCYD